MSSPYESAAFDLPRQFILANAGVVSIACDTGDGSDDGDDDEHGFAGFPRHLWRTVTRGPGVESGCVHPVFEKVVDAGSGGVLRFLADLDIPSIYTLGRMQRKHMDFANMSEDSKAKLSSWTQSLSSALAGAGEQAEVVMLDTSRIRRHTEVFWITDMYNCGYVPETPEQQELSRELSDKLLVYGNVELLSHAYRPVSLRVLNNRGLQTLLRPTRATDALHDDDTHLTTEHIDAAMKVAEAFQRPAPPGLLFARCVENLLAVTIELICIKLEVQNELEASLDESPIPQGRFAKVMELLSSCLDEDLQVLAYDSAKKYRTPLVNEAMREDRSSYSVAKYQLLDGLKNIIKRKSQAIQRENEIEATIRHMAKKTKHMVNKIRRNFKAA